jgi:hypothetical protein
MTFLTTYVFLKTLPVGNDCACLVEAVGIEEQAIHRVLTVLQGFSRTEGVGLSAQERCESGFSDNFETG